MEHSENECDNPEHRHYDRRHFPYDNKSWSIKDIIPVIVMISSLIVLWVNIEKTLTILSINQDNIQKDFIEFEDNFDEHNDKHSINIEVIKEQVNSLERSVLLTFKNKNEK
jgi:hypothetical protein